MLSLKGNLAIVQGAEKGAFGGTKKISEKELNIRCNKIQVILLNKNFYSFYN